MSRSSNRRRVVVALIGVGLLVSALGVPGVQASVRASCCRSITAGCPSATLTSCCGGERTPSSTPARTVGALGSSLDAHKAVVATAVSVLLDSLTVRAGRLAHAAPAHGYRPLDLPTLNAVLLI